MPERKLYLCHNPACPLGSMKQPGRFTGGITAQAKHLLTGDPLESLENAADVGEGICPNCGEPGEEYDPTKAAKDALAEAKSAYDAQVKAIKEGVA